MKTYNTLSALVDYVESLPPAKDGGDTLREDWWAAGASLLDCMALARNGWPEGVKQARALLDALGSRIAATSYDAVADHITMDVQGAAWDMGTALQGVPEAWQVLTPAVSKRAVRLVVNTDTSGGVADETMVKRGAAIAALVLGLQARGFPVTVQLVMRTEPRTKGFTSEMLCTLVTVCEANGSPLDVDRLVFALAHPGMFRQLLRAAACGRRESAHAGNEWDRSRPVPQWKPEGPIDIFVEGCGLWESNKWGDPETWIMDELKKQS